MTFVRRSFMSPKSVHMETVVRGRTLEDRTIECPKNYLLTYRLSPRLVYLSLSLVFSLSLYHSISLPLPFNNPVLRHRVITTRSTMGGNHWRLFTATSSSRQLISVEPISFLKETTQELPIDEHKSSNPSCRPSFSPPFASCY